MTGAAPPPTGSGRGTRPDPELVNPDPRTVTVWSDIGCPWATLAMYTLHTAATDRGTDLRVDHRAFPLELFNQAPTPKELVDAEVMAIAGHVPRLGWQLWNAAPHAYPSTLLPALEAVQAVKNASWGGLVASDELDSALRHAYFAASRAIQLHPVILDIAEGCEHVDRQRLAAALATGQGRAAVYRQWQRAQSDDVQGSPHLFAAAGRVAIHNPGATYHWTARPPLDFPLQPHGFPVLDDYQPQWADELLDQLLDHAD